MFEIVNRVSSRSFWSQRKWVAQGLAAFLLLAILPACSYQSDGLKDTLVTADNQAEVYEKVRTGTELTGEEVQLLNEYLKRAQLPEGTYLPAGKTVGQMIQEQRGYQQGIQAAEALPGEAPQAEAAQGSAAATPRPADRGAPPRGPSPGASAPSASAGPETTATAPGQPDRPQERAAEPEAPAAPTTAVVPAGETIRVRLEQSVSSKTNQAGDRFQASLDRDLVVDGHLLAPKGSRITGRLTEAKSAGRVKGRARLALTLERAVVEGQSYSLNTNTLSFEADPSKKEDAKKIGIGAGAGAVIGAIAGGKKGAAIGGAIGAGAGTGAVLVTSGEEVSFGVEQPFEFTLSQDLEMKLVKR